MLAMVVLPGMVAYGASQLLIGISLLRRPADGGSRVGLAAFLACLIAVGLAWGRIGGSAFALTVLIALLCLAARGVGAISKRRLAKA